MHPKNGCIWTLVLFTNLHWLSWWHWLSKCRDALGFRCQKYQMQSLFFTGIKEKFRPDCEQVHVAVMSLALNLCLCVCRPGSLLLRYQPNTVACLHQAEEQHASCQQTTRGWDRFASHHCHPREIAVRAFKKLVCSLQKLMDLKIIHKVHKKISANNLKTVITAQNTKKLDELVCLI